MLEQANRLLLHQLLHHITEDGAYGVEALVRLTDIVEAHVVEENFLDNENGYSLTELTASLHDAQAQRDDLRGKKEVDDIRRVVLNERANDTEGSEAQIFERARLGGGIEEWVEEERDVRWNGVSGIATRTEVVTYRLETGTVSLCGKRHTGEGREHCRRGSKPRR